jgi:hypothetical protein
MPIAKEIPDDLFVAHVDELIPYLSRGICEALWRHKRLKQSVAAWRDGKAVMVPPEEIPVEDDRPEWKLPPEK